MGHRPIRQYSELRNRMTFPIFVGHGLYGSRLDRITNSGSSRTWASEQQEIFRLTAVRAHKNLKHEGGWIHYVEMREPCFEKTGFMDATQTRSKLGRNNAVLTFASRTISNKLKV